MLRSWDPRLNPSLRPDQWREAARLVRLRFLAAVAVLLSVAAGVVAYLYYPVDRTRDMTPEAVVEAAGLALLQAGYYRFRVDLSGESAQYPFPESQLQGEYQRSPQALHLKGTVLSGEVKVPLEYYLEGSDLYMYHPTRQMWLLLKDSALDELAAFLPENQAAPFVGGIRAVELMGREQLPAGEALRFKLDMDPTVMLPQQDTLQKDRVDYWLWVYTRTLKPARFSATVARTDAGSGADEIGTHFAYSVTWEFDRSAPVAVPEAVKTAAQDLGNAQAAPDLLPGNPAETGEAAP